MSDYGSPPQDPNEPRPPQQPDWSQPSQPPSPPPPPPGYGYGQPPPAPGYGQQPYGQPAYGQPSGPPPANNLVWAILSTVLCCLPLGIASIVFASQVNSKYAAGDLAGAQESSRKAKLFAIWSAVAGVVVGIAYVGLAILGIRSGGSS